MQASVLITTKNRREELRRALESVRAQTIEPDVLVIDDGSTDGTAEMILGEFPEVRLHRSERSLGLVVQRNTGMRLARGRVVVSVDDDAVLSSPRIVEQTLGDFDDPCVGAVAIPCVEGGREPPFRRPTGTGVAVVSEFTGGSCAIRRDVFAQVGGFRESVFHQGEERDFCVRLLAAGWVVRLGRAEPIHHYPSPHRDLRRMDVYGSRNTILYAWHNEPFPSALIRMVEMSVKGVALGVRLGRPLNKVEGLLLGYRACWEERSERRPVSRQVNRVFRRLWKHGPLPLAEIAWAVPHPDRAEHTRGLRAPW